MEKCKDEVCNRLVAAEKVARTSGQAVTVCGELSTSLGRFEGTDWGPRKVCDRSRREVGKS